MKTPIFLFFVFSLIFSGCKDEPKQKTDENSSISDSLSDTTPDTLSPTFDPSEKQKSGKPNKADILTGIFIRSNSESGSCECNCVEVNFTQTTELCLDKKTGLSIMAKYRRMPEGTLGIYFDTPKKEEGIADKKIPWDDFDKNTPIAIITYSTDNTFDLDWVGFNIEGELATDYAIYGKKNLEGSYRKL